MIAESITYNGVVTDSVTGEPIPGVKVEVYHKLSRDPKTGDWITLATTKQETDATGMYSFILSPDQLAEGSLYVEVKAQHPDYVSFGPAGYSYSMIRKNITLGETPFFSQIKLRPGVAITGMVVDPEGVPQADVPITMVSAKYLPDSFSYSRGSTSGTLTDENGKFRIVRPEPGDGVVWIKPVKYSPLAFRTADRLDWGSLTLQDGVTLTGHVVDTEGEPVEGVRVEARRDGDGREVDRFLKQVNYANQVGRKAVTGPSGKFTLDPLPEGEYTLRIESNSDSYNHPPVEQVYLRHRVLISSKVDPKELLIRLYHI